MRLSHLVALAALALVVLAALALALGPRPGASSDDATSRTTTAPLAAPPLGAIGWTSTRDALARASFDSDGGLARAYDAGPPVESTGLAARAAARALCPRFASTMRAGRRRHGCAPTDEDDAVEEHCTSGVDRRFGWMDDSLVVDTAAVEACLRGLERDAAAGTTVYLEIACNELLRDAAQESEPCTHEGYGCGHDGFCTNGACLPAAARGAPCSEMPCARDLVCVAGLCALPTPRGGACDEDAACADPGDACENGRCGPVDAGHVEAPDGACATDLDCDGYRRCVGLEVARCVPAPELGQPCSGAYDCGQLQCSAEGVCVDPMPSPPFGPLGEGAPCELSARGEECASGLRCAYELEGYRCVRPAALGEECERAGCLEGCICEWQIDEGRCEAELCDSHPFQDDEE